MDRTKVEILRAALLDVVQEIRQELADQDVGHFSFKINADGRTVAGHASVSFFLGKKPYYDHVQCNCPIAAVDEFLHREQFAKDYQAILLPSPGLGEFSSPHADDDDEIPF